MFANRREAGCLLAERLSGREFRHPLVLGIPRGGVVVAAALARSLKADLDVVLARKLRDPAQPEFALGAVGETGEVILNPSLAGKLEHLRDHIEQERRHQQGEIERRRELFRAARPPAAIAGRSVILTDDGIATGSTMIAALQAIRSRHPWEVMVAVPVGAPDSLAKVAQYCDEVVCLCRPSSFVAVGEFYQDFIQVEDEEVVAIMREFDPRRLRNRKMPVAKGPSVG